MKLVAMRQIAALLTLLRATSRAASNEPAINSGVCSCYDCSEDCMVHDDFGFEVIFFHISLGGTKTNVAEVRTRWQRD